MSLDELRKRRELLDKKTDNTLKEVEDIVNESIRVGEIAGKAREIVDNLDEQFEKETMLEGKDIAFLFWAVMLQTMRWVLMPELKLVQLDELQPSVTKENRLKANEKNHEGGIYDGKSSGALYETNKLQEYRNQDKYENKVKKTQDAFCKGDNNYISWIEILTRNVPYDATQAKDALLIPNIAGLNKRNSKGLYNNIYGNNHHVATLGHDPILGWLFGTANIMTDTISFVDFTNYDVIRGHEVRSLGVFNETNELQFADMRIDYASPRDAFDIINECIQSAREDEKRIPAAVIRQAIHFASDKYCVEGLPIPILSTINTKKAQELIEKGWNSEEFKKLLKLDLAQVGISAAVDICINIIIETIYLFCCDSDEDVEIRKAKIKRILEVGSAITTSSNLVYVAVTDNMKKIDIGGVGVTLVKIFTTDSFIAQLKREYITRHFSELVNKNEE